jgi:hypothetical protein
MKLALHKLDKCVSHKAKVSQPDADKADSHRSAWLLRQYRRNRNCLVSGNAVRSLFLIREAAQIMKRALVGFAIVTSLLNCARATPSGANDSGINVQRQIAASPKPLDVSQITLVQTPEHMEKTNIRADARAYLAAKDFVKLEQLATKYRTSKSCYANGIWKLGSVYGGMVPGTEKPDAEWEASLAALREWTEARPDSITARVALANALVDYGWKARGTGWANTVTETGWKLFGERLTAAVQVLKQASTLSEKCPYWWDVMFTATRGLGVKKPDYEALFRQAISFEPNCTGYYGKMAVYLLPRWGGKPGDLAAFAQESADKLGGDEGDMLYARIIWSAQSSSGNVFREADLSWERADRGFQIIEKRFPDSPYVQNGRAYIAVLGCGKTLAPRRLVEDLHGKIDPATWTSKENFIKLTRNLYPQ